MLMIKLPLIMEREETCTSNDYTPNAVHVLQFGKKLKSIYFM